MQSLLRKSFLLALNSPLTRLKPALKATIVNCASIQCVSTALTNWITDQDCSILQCKATLSWQVSELYATNGSPYAIICRKCESEKSSGDSKPAAGDVQGEKEKVKTEEEKEKEKAEKQEEEKKSAEDPVANLAARDSAGKNATPTYERLGAGYYTCEGCKRYQYCLICIATKYLTLNTQDINDKNPPPSDMMKGDYFRYFDDSPNVGK